ITYDGVSLGTVVATFDSPPVIPGLGQGAITASLALNTDPHDLVTLIRTQAVKNGLNTDAFDALLALQAGANPPSSVFEGFNVADFVIKAMSGLAVDITMSTTVKLGEYQVTMPYTQTGVPTATDQTILKLVPIVGTPIAQLLVERSILAFDSINILTLGETNFQTDISGAITETGPLDAQIMFPNPVTISYGGKAIGSMMMPTVNAIANQGAVLDLKGVAFTILDLAAFTEFNIFALNNPKFEWTISTDGLVVNAMGAALPGVSMTKTVTLDGFNKLASLELASYIINTIDDGGLHMDISASISNPSTIGMTIPLSQFNTMFHGMTLGPASAEGLTLIPHGTSTFVLKATIATGNGDLRPLLTGIFQNAVDGVATPLEAQGVGAPGVSWLDAAIKSLALETSLPPLSEPPIASVVIDAMSMDFTCATCVWAPTAESTITAVTNLPFANGAPIVSLSQNVEILDKDGALVGVLDTPYAPATTVGNSVTASTPPAPLVIADGSHEIYSTFVGDLNEATTYELGLRGTANSILDLGALGQIEVKNIKLDVRTSLDGLQGLKNVEYKSLMSMDMMIKPGYIVVTVLVNIHNPSKLTLNLGDLELTAGLDFTEENMVGPTTIVNLKLSPGDNTVVSILAINTALPGGTYVLMQTAIEDVPLVLYANSESSQNPALNAGLQSLRSATIIPKDIPSATSAMLYDRDWSVKILPTTATDGLVEVTGTFNNPFFLAEARLIRGFADPGEFDVNQASGIGLNGDPRLLFIPTKEFNFVLASNETRVITTKMKLASYDAATVDRFQKLVALGTESFKMAFTWWPVVSIGSDPTNFGPDWSNTEIYRDTADMTLTMHVGPDFASVLDYYTAQAPKLAPISNAASATVSATSAPIASPTASPTPFPTTEIPPTPTPTTVEPTPTEAPTSPEPSNPEPSSPAAPSPSPPPVMSP
ncbi:hypothetical protein BG011_001589, partial [Mortierella polycephala]